MTDLTHPCTGCALQSSWAVVKRNGKDTLVSQCCEPHAWPTRIAYGDARPKWCIGPVKTRPATAARRE